MPALGAREADGDDKIVLCPRCHGLGAYPSCPGCMAPGSAGELHGEILRASTAAAYERIRKDAEAAIYAAMMPGLAAQVGFGLDSEALRLALASKVKLNPTKILYDPPGKRQNVDLVISSCPRQFDPIGWRAAVLAACEKRDLPPSPIVGVAWLSERLATMRSLLVLRPKKDPDAYDRAIAGLTGMREIEAYDRAVAAAGRPPAYEKRYHPRRRR